MLCDNIGRAADGGLLFAGQRVNALADRWGTPLYLMDEDRIRQNCRMYLSAFRESFGEDALPLYAGKAASFRQMYRIVAEEGLGIDAVSPGEIATALSAGYPAEKIYYHGDGKTDEDIRFALGQGVGCFVVDNGDELLALNAAAAAAHHAGHRPAHLPRDQHRRGGREVRRARRDRTGDGIRPRRAGHGAHRGGRAALPRRLDGV